ncbi:hypothetical protein KO516_02910 [Citreicella sp. C3M06]|uniref:hypothetical protein n=1 Tax=Citreicella sp. C3M06 TaxID=2841564 RepID=UPI001C0880B1|nr:hypothetical protein [Citreicella sp. C3M06]MBU2959793.1 hypothetical protein [Citreicella sp. C3M06]
MKPLLTAAILVTMAGAALAQDLFVPTIHARQMDGSYKSYPIKGAEDGMDRDACDRQARSWIQKNRAAIQAADNSMSAPGSGNAIQVICEGKG